MPKDLRSRVKAGPYSRPPLSMPALGAMPKGRELYVGRVGQWAIGRVVRWFGKADDSSHWYELAFAPPGGAAEWFDLAPARRAIGAAVNGSWAFPEDEDISPCSASASARRLGDLTKHVRAVHEKRRDHACPHCAAAFGQAGHLTKHVRTMHKDDGEDGLLLL